jgi:hypothetical protein
MMGLKSISFAKARALLSVGFQLGPDGADQDFSPPELNWSLFETFFKSFLHPNTGLKNAKKYFSGKMAVK